MRTSFIVVAALLLTGCESSPPSGRLDADQARTAALKLANDKADALFHRRPFQDGDPAQFADGRWIWTGHQGVHLEEFVARVELAADGSTNSVDIQLLDDAVRPWSGGRVGY